MSAPNGAEKNANTAAAGSTSAPEKPKEQPKDIPSLGALDEDDEFEEFEAQDWDDAETSLAHLNSEGGATGLSISGEHGTGGVGATASGGVGDHLWEDNWDDDDVEDDFAKALRTELEQHTGKSAQGIASS